MVESSQVIVTLCYLIFFWGASAPFLVFVSWRTITNDNYQFDSENIILIAVYYEVRSSRIWSMKFVISVWISRAGCYR